MLELTFLLLGVGALAALMNWKRGLEFCVITGMLQDPMRKLVEGQPVYFVVLVGAVFGAGVVGAFLAKERLAPKYIVGWSDRLEWPFRFFVILVLLQAVHSYIRFGNVMMTGIGLFVWLAPVIALGYAYRIAIRRGLVGIRQWVSLYCVLTIAFLSGVYLEFAGVDWTALGAVGEGLKIYDIGTVFMGHSGFFRSSEIAAWHTATAACLVFTLSIGRKITATRLAAGALVVGLLVGLGILTGRRKLIVEIAIFLTAYFALLYWYHRRQGRRALGLILVGAVAVGMLVEVLGPDNPSASRTVWTYESGQAQQYQLYALRGQSVAEDVPQRLLDIGLAPIMWAIDSLGWSGSGLGTGSQGTGGLDEIGRNIGAAEGGLGKIAVELGVPGLIIVSWLALAIGAQFHRILRLVAQSSQEHLQVTCGFLAILVAKTSSFAVAAQAFSDMFILLLLGSTIGFVFAMPVLVRRVSASDARAASIGGDDWARRARQA